jgi:hypothetical protein
MIRLVIAHLAAALPLAASPAFNEHTPSLPGAGPRFERPQRGGRKGKFLAAMFQSSRVMAALCAATMLGFATAARADDNAPPPSFTFHGFDKTSYSAQAQEGLDEILSGRMFNASVPMFVVEAATAGAGSMRGVLGYDPTSPEGIFYSTGALPSPGEAQQGRFLGLSKFERNGATLASANCFVCHAGAVNGLVVAGMGSNSVVQQTPKLKSTRGDNYGQYVVWTFASKLKDPAKTGLLTSNEKTALVELMKNTLMPPVQPMPWWLMKYKVRDYWYGDGGPANAAHFSLNFTIASANVNELHAAHVASTAKALAFARETVSPIFPGSLDASLVQLGADLFHARKAPADPSEFEACFRCHGTYTKKPSSSDFSKPGSWSVDYKGSEKLKDVGTDGEYNAVIRKFQPITEHISKLKDYYDAQGTPELFPRHNPLPGIGYVPPPLVGVWATAPYFHNGSVPTIEAVLNSALRPEIWERNQNPRAYDLARVGMEFTAISRADHDARTKKAATALPLSKAALDQTFIYDTKGFGRANTGHTFGDSLNAGERAAIIEFLKSLSGPDM